MSVSYACGPLVWPLGGTRGTVGAIGGSLNLNQYFINAVSHSKLDLCDPNLHPLFNIDVESQSVSTVPHESFLHLLLVWKSNSYMHNIEGGFAFACLHFFFNIKYFGTLWLPWPFVLTASTQFCHRWAMHCESWTCAYLCDVTSRHTCRPIQLNVWAFCFVCVIHRVKHRTL